VRHLNTERENMLYYALKNIGADIWSLRLTGSKENVALHSFFVSQYEQRFYEGADDLERDLGVGYMSFSATALKNFLENMNFRYLNSVTGLLESFPNTRVHVKPEWHDWHIWGIKACTCARCGKVIPGVKLPWTGLPTACFECDPDNWPLRVRQHQITKTAGYAKCG